MPRNKTNACICLFLFCDFCHFAFPQYRLKLQVTNDTPFPAQVQITRFNTIKFSRRESLRTPDISNQQALLTHTSPVQPYVYDHKHKHPSNQPVS